MGLELASTSTLGTLPVYVAPVWRADPCAYWTVATSAGFVLVGAAILGRRAPARGGLPRWFGALNVVCGGVSVAHHLRTYHQAYDDWLRIADLALAVAYAAAVLGLLGGHPLTWVAAGTAAVAVWALRQAPTPDAKCAWHAAFHLSVLLNTLYHAVPDLPCPCPCT
jgi:hypothetical protein